jgi:hypothetical protein
MSIWKITPEGPVKVPETIMKEEQLLEEHLENWVITDSSLLGEPLLVIGRQVVIPEIKDRLDVLALDPQGNAVVVELKRGKLKDPVDMQALRYASYISKWRFEDFENQARAYLNTADDPDFNFNELYEQFCTDAGIDEIPDLNSDQRVIIVGSEVKDKLGSVALWLHDHNIDIKVIEVEVYREGENILIRPNIIIPLPVSRFEETGRVPPGKRDPWISEGKTWHLDKRCSPKTKEMLINLDELIRDHFEVEGPRWNQKLYVAYRVGAYNWLYINTHSSTLKMNFLVKAGVFDQSKIAESLNVKGFDKDDSLSEKLGLPSSVLVQNRNEATDRITLRVKEDFNLEEEAFLVFLKEAYEAFPK